MAAATGDLMLSTAGAVMVLPPGYCPNGHLRGGRSLNGAG